MEETSIHTPACSQYGGDKYTHTCMLTIWRKQVYTHLHAHNMEETSIHTPACSQYGGKAVLGLPVAVHNTPRLIRTLLCQPYVYLHGAHMHTADVSFHRSRALPLPAAAPFKYIPPSSHTTILIHLLDLHAYHALRALIRSSNDRKVTCSID